MKSIKRIGLCISLLILIIFVTSCDVDNKITGDSKEEQIKKSFAKTLEMYPIKNLEDLYDKEGYRDGEFKKDDKGTWVLYSAIVSQPKGESLKSRGMILKLDRNKRTAKGSYIIRELKEDKNHDVQKNEKKYPVKLVNNRIVLVKDVKDKKLKNEIESFELFSQYGNFNHFDRNEITNISYNPNAPNYSAQYQLKNSDYNVEQLRKRYNIPTKKAPKLLLKGSGNLKGSSVGYKNIEFTFVENKKENIYFTDSVYFNPSEDK
ncbi:TPA: tandem-type lipoprotein [Staphylococcus aureus]|nr:tandem-type lipoprotein [Staphylococcus aureus]HDA2272219.1 tandem-type lipoprotein [Staphylococcus aureus]